MATFQQLTPEYQVKALNPENPGVGKSGRLTGEGQGTKHPWPNVIGMDSRPIPTSQTKDALRCT